MQKVASRSQAAGNSRRKSLCSIVDGNSTDARALKTAAHSYALNSSLIAVLLEMDLYEVEVKAECWTARRHGFE